MIPMPMCVRLLRMDWMSFKLWNIGFSVINNQSTPSEKSSMENNGNGAFLYKLIYYLTKHIYRLNNYILVQNITLKGVVQRVLHC